MKTLTTTLLGLAFATVPAMALDHHFMDQVMQSAQNIERDAKDVNVVLRNKRAGMNEISPKLEAMGADVAKLRALVDEFEASQKTLSERDRTDWELLKERVRLIEIFHNQKSQLASQNLDKNRGLIRAHAQGVALRAARLQETAAKLRRSAVS